MNYNKLKPGMYLQIGDKMTAIKSTNAEMWQQILTGSPSKNMSLESLANKVGWTYVALNERSDHIKRIHLQWRQGDTDIDNPPYEMRMNELIGAMDLSMQIYGCAYWYKERNAFGQVVKVIWLDPQSIEVDLVDLDENGQIKTFWRTLHDNTRIALPAEDVIYFKTVGLRELEPGNSAVNATRVAGDLLYGADLALSSLYNNNALPITLIFVPPGTGPEDRNWLRQLFERKQNPKTSGTRENRSIAVSREVQIEQLSIDPDKLAVENVEEANRLEILAANAVPQSVVFANAANHATRRDDAIKFYESLASRLEYMAEVLKYDADFEGYELIPQPEKLAPFQAAMLEMVQGLAPLYPNIVTANEIRERIGLEPMAEEPQPEPEGNDLAGEFFQQGAKEAEKRAEIVTFKKWLKRRDNPDVEEFNSEILDHTEKLKIYFELGMVKYDHTINSDETDYP